METGNTFKIDGDTYKVTKSGSVPQAMFLKTSAARAKVKIPAVVKKDGISYKVTAIADQALRLDKTIKTLIIGNHVTVIGARAFANCWQLKKVTIGTGLKRIGKEAFRGCQKLKAVTIRSEKLKKSALVRSEEANRVSGLQCRENVSGVTRSSSKMILLHSDPFDHV